MRENLKEIIGLEISGTAKLCKKGHRCLLRNVAVDDYLAFDPDVFLALEDHLWTNADVFEKHNIKKHSYFAFEGKVYKYKRSNGSVDYSIRMDDVKELDILEYLREKVQQIYCRECCMFFEHCYYNCIASQEDQDRVIQPILEQMYLYELVDNFAEDYEYNPKMYKNKWKENPLLKTDKGIVHVGMQKAEFANRFKQMIDKKQKYGYSLKPVCINGTTVNPNVLFGENGMCESIGFFVDTDDFETFLTFIQKEYKTNVVENPEDIELIEHLNKESQFDGIAYFYCKCKSRNQFYFVITLPTAACIYFDNICESTKKI